MLMIHLCTSHVEQVKKLFDAVTLVCSMIALKVAEVVVIYWELGHV